MCLSVCLSVYLSVCMLGVFVPDVSCLCCSGFTVDVRSVRTWNEIGDHCVRILGR